MTLDTLLSQLEELSRQWHGKDFYDTEYDAGRAEGYDAAADDLDLLIDKSKEVTTDTVP